jgi:cellulase
MDKNADGSAWPRFATGDFVDQNSQWTVTIPKDLKAGQYLIRHEIIALHLANELGGAEL